MCSLSSSSLVPPLRLHFRSEAAIQRCLSPSPSSGLLHHYRLDVQLPSHSFSLLARGKSTGLSSSIEVTGASQQGHVFLPVNHMLTRPAKYVIAGVATGSAGRS
jgi:hypothetical protein